MSMKNPLTPAGIEPAIFRYVAQHVNPIYIYIYIGGGQTGAVDTVAAIGSILPAPDYR